jgi:hypothetical protein
VGRNGSLGERIGLRGIFKDLRIHRKIVAQVGVADDDYRREMSSNGALEGRRSAQVELALSPSCILLLHGGRLFKVCRSAELDLLLLDLGSMKTLRCVRSEFMLDRLLTGPNNFR